MLRKNQFMEKLRRGEIAYGVQIGSTSPLVAELVSRCGYDFIYIETEHYAWNDQSIEDCIRAIQLGGSTPLVRIPSHDEGRIGLMFDIGAQGLIIPHCDTAEDAAELVRASKYTPLGERGSAFGGDRGSLSAGAAFGQISQKEYMDESNRELPIIPMIESAAGVHNIEEIVRQPIDALRIGRSDLSCSLGYFGRKDAPEYIEALRHVIRVAREHNLSVGTHVTTLEDARAMVELGFGWISYCSDLSYLATHLYRDLQQLRSIGT